MLRASRPTRILAATVTAGLLAGLAGLAAATPATAEEFPPHEQIVDLTFPTDPRVTYADSYHAGRSGGRQHKATDMMGQKGWLVAPAVGGRVTYIPGADGEAEPSYGYMITVAGDDGREYNYIHLNNDTPGTDDGQGGPQHAYAPGLTRGSRVERGQFIGFLGDSGNAESTGAHLHFEIEDPAVTDPYGSYRINPLRSLNWARLRQDYPHVTAVAARATTLACPTERVPSTGFGDVDRASTHGLSIDCTVWWHVARGTESTRYSPRSEVTRGQLASYVDRLLAQSGAALPPATADHFSDDDGDAHEDAVNRLAEAGILGGTAPGRFAPGSAVTHDQTATFLVRAQERAAGAALAGGDDAFVDDPGNTHEGNINKAAAAGFVAGTAPGTFNPRGRVTRDQMATFLARALDRAVEEGRAHLPA